MSKWREIGVWRVHKIFALQFRHYKLQEPRKNSSGLRQPEHFHTTAHTTVWTDFASVDIYYLHQTLLPQVNLQSLVRPLDLLGYITSPTCTGPVLGIQLLSQERLSFTFLYYLWIYWDITCLWRHRATCSVQFAVVPQNVAPREVREPL